MKNLREDFAIASSIPSDVQQLVAEMLASGHYDSEAAIMREALRLLKQRDDLKHDVRQAIVELDRGEGIEGEQVFRELRGKATNLGTKDA